MPSSFAVSRLSPRVCRSVSWITRISISASGMPIGNVSDVAEIEMRVIHETLRHTRGDKRLTAKLLGIATRTIYRRLEASGEGGGDEHPDDDADGTKES